MDKHHMRRSLVEVANPAVEPVTATEAKNFLRVDTTADDDLISSLIVSARIAVENYTHKRLITQTLEYKKDALASLPGVLFFSSQGYIDLPGLPIQSITSIKTYNLANVESTLSSDAYTLDGSGGRVYLNSSYTWPTETRDYAAVAIRYVAGYGDASSDVPEPFKVAILLLVSDMYNNRMGCRMTSDVSGLLAAYKSYDRLEAY